MQSRHDKSIPLLRKTLQLNPNYPDAHNNLGLASTGDLAAAIASFNTALKLKPNYPDAQQPGQCPQGTRRLNRCHCLLQHRSAQAQPPRSPQHLGAALQEQGDLTAAIASVNTALKLKPNYPGAHNNLGVALKEQGDLPLPLPPSTRL